MSFNGGDAGNGTGGSVNIILSGGSLTADLLDAGADGFGGAAGENCPDCEGGGTTSFRAGNGQGGSAGLLISGGTATLGALALSAQGAGGEAEGESSPQSAAAIPGAGSGGHSPLDSRGGTVDATPPARHPRRFGGEGSPGFQ